MKTLALSARTVLLAAPEVGPLQEFRRESVVFRRHQDGTGLFLIESGLVKLVRISKAGRKLILSVMGAHQVAGEESLAEASLSYEADVVCLTDVTGYFIPVSTVQRLLANPDFAAAFLAYALLRDRERIGRIEMLALCDVEHRILHGLAELTHLVEPNADGSTYSIPMTQAEIASFIGATRETTSSTLSNLQTRGLVTLGRRLVTAVDSKILIDAANHRLAKGKGASG